MNLIYLGDGHYQNKEAYEVNYNSYKGIGRPRFTDYKIKKLERLRKVSTKKASVKPRRIDLKSPAILVSYLFIMWFLTTLKG